MGNLDKLGNLGKPSKDGWLIVGAAVGLAVALVNVAGPRDQTSATLSQSTVASVNAVAIRRESFERALELVAGDKRDSAAPIVPIEILDRLVDEELLVQRAVDLDLVRSDAAVRRVLVRAMIDSIVLEAESEPLDERSLQAYYDGNRGRFASHATARIERVVVHDRGDGDNPRARADAVAKLLRAGADADHVRRKHGDRASVPLPAGKLLLTELREYLGPDGAKAVSESSAGAVLGPLSADGGYTVIRVLELMPAARPQLEDVRSHVAAAYRKERVDQALRDYLARLRARAAIVVSDDLRAGGRS